MPATAKVDAITQQITDLQRQIAALENQRSDLLRADVYLDSLRPVGIPKDWLPVYEEVPPQNPQASMNYRVTAWYDPQKWGTGCNIVGKL